MKDYCHIKEYEHAKYYYNEKKQLHRITGPAREWKNGSKTYYINNICYMFFSKTDNKLIIYLGILKLNLEYEKYIKQNIKELILEYDPIIKLFYFENDAINKLPNWMKDFLI